MAQIKHYIREKRIEKGYSQRAFGKATGINWHTIQRWEYNQVIPRDVYSLYRVAKVCNCKIEDLFDWDSVAEYEKELAAQKLAEEESQE